MQERSPHFLLFSDATGEARRADRWRFVLQSVGGQLYLSAEDIEPGTRLSRLELLAVVRGLEALDQPSRVTLVTRSRYVTRGIRRGLGQWRARRWRWEHFGELVPIRDHDLWQRVDRAMQFHEVNCYSWMVDTLDESHEVTPAALGALSVDSIVEEPALLPVPDFEPVDVAHERRSDTPRVADLAACNAGAKAPMLPSRRTREEQQTTAESSSTLARTLDRLRQNVLAPLSHLCRPAFTRAA